MIVIARISFPQNELNKAVRAFTSLKRLPDDIQMGGPYFKLNGEEIEAITYYQFPREGVSDPVAYVSDRYQAFDGVEGFTQEIARWQRIDEAIGRLTA